MNKTGILCLLSLIFAQSACAASFDCAKAGTKVEKMICADAELSKLDEKLGKVYFKALKKTPDLIAFKQQQRDWLKERNGCVDTGCLKAQYQQRTGELERIISLVPKAKGQESHYFKKEADKLKVIQDVVRHQELSYYHPYIKEPEFCVQLLKDFIAGESFKAVEPDVRTNNVNHPALVKLSDQCKNSEPKPITETEFRSVGLLGGPPYRYYRIGLDGNPENSMEEVLYTESTPTGFGSTGYAWVDPKACLVVGGAGMGSRQIPNRIPQNLYRLSTLIIYQNSLFFLGLKPSFWGTYPTGYRLQISRINRDQKPFGCAWHPPVPEEERSNTQKSKHNGGK